jgi:hypothetical protein
MPSRARRRSSSSPASGRRRTASDSPARPTATNETASTVIAVAVPPAATSRLPHTGPTVKPSARAVSTVPFVCCRLREPETAGTSANSAACATAIPTPRSAASARSGATELTAASTTATPAWANGDEHEERARLDPVDEQSDVLGEDHDGRPQADE